jgi:hypothetical protein
MHLGRERSDQGGVREWILLDDERSSTTPFRDMLKIPTTMQKTRMAIT